MDINTVLKSHFVLALTQAVCGDDIELIKRPASFMIRNKTEEGRDIHRLIILPPKGYTADKINQTNSHDEAAYATIQIKGGVREGKKGFSKLRDSLLVASIPENGTTSDLGKPYLTFDVENDNNPDLMLTRHDAGTAPFAVVKSNGYGFYHNLINLSDDWLVLQLYKQLREQRGVEMAGLLAKVSKPQAEILQRLYKTIVREGDALFQKEPKLVDAVCRLPLSVSLPALSEMLYVHDTGKHEACSVFAVILKIGKAQPKAVRDFLTDAIEAKTIPTYYGEQLVQKIDRERVQPERIPAVA